MSGQLCLPLMLSRLICNMLSFSGKFVTSLTNITEAIMRNLGVDVCNLDHISRLVVNLHHQKWPIGGRSNFVLRNHGPYPTGPRPQITAYNNTETRLIRLGSFVCWAHVRQK